MGQWFDMDSDAERLPSGFERIGHDADTQTYTFRDADGIMYESEPGNRYGELHRVDSPSSSQSSRSASIHLLDNRSGPSSRTFDEMFNDHQDMISKDNRETVRMMLPFALIGLVFLILVFKLLYTGDAESLTHPKGSLDCHQGSHEVQIKQADTCWAIAQTSPLTVEEMLELQCNAHVDRDQLVLGKGICVPA
ncbi:carbohydrate-binding module family 50 protein [Bipolaris oryzae ATCC 44560]|uniref:Carbohydrate-binding module family 50 protein n=1 Tax=Bipolaris oryzae ATCC 44560 TaxID=930090 RepID=W6Z7Y7_COCMI|nr:carbohydrate-binding module family 50 protein [Bipolaris oryzae ATCC 44560]EUC39801.1 carbohydrate-binding module family 50 protein [Bipolaris oryzae ATCC 44560]